MKRIVTLIFLINLTCNVAMSHHNEAHSDTEVTQEDPSSFDQGMRSVFFLRIPYALLNAVGSLFRFDKISDSSYINNIVSNSSFFYSATAGVLGDIVNDTNVWIKRFQLKNSDYVASKTAYVCTAPLPTDLLPTFFGPLTQLRHAWIDINGSSYGLPYTNEETYFGGSAVLKNPDPFVSDLVNNHYCTPIYYHKRNSEEEFSRDIKCVANTLANFGEFELNEKLFVNFDYHALKHNCTSATKLIATCSRSVLSQVPNLEVGSNPEKLPMSTYRAKDYVKSKYHMAWVKVMLESLKKRVIETLRDQGQQKAHELWVGPRGLYHVEKLFSAALEKNWTSLSIEERSYLKDMNLIIQDLSLSVTNILTGFSNANPSKRQELNQKVNAATQISIVFEEAVFSIGSRVIYTAIQPSDITKLCTEVRRRCGMD